MNSYPDKQYARYIYTGLSQGFCIGFDRDHSSSACNHPLATAHRSVVSKYIKSEVELGRIVYIAIFNTLIPKPHQVSKWQLIVDLSYPRGYSVNAGILEELAFITCARVNDAVECTKLFL